MLKLKWILLAFLIISLHSDVVAQVPVGNPTFDVIEFLIGRRAQTKISRKKHKYNRNVWKYIYFADMKDGARLEVNSSIFKDPESGKHFLYYNDKGLIKKIFPDQTLRIIKQNPYLKEKNFKDIFDDIPLVGVPLDSCWRFQVIRGEIDGYSSFYKSIQVNEVRLNDKIIPVDSKELENILMGNQKAYEAFLNKEYFQAISIFNER